MFSFLWVRHLCRKGYPFIGYNPQTSFGIASRKKYPSGGRTYLLKYISALFRLSFRDLSTQTAAPHLPPFFVLIYLFHMNQAWIQSRARKQFLCHCIRLSFLRPHIAKRSEGKIQWANAKNFIFCFCLSHIQKKNGVFTGSWRIIFYFCAKK